MTGPHVFNRDRKCVYCGAQQNEVLGHSCPQWAVVNPPDGLEHNRGGVMNPSIAANYTRLKDKYASLDPPMPLPRVEVKVMVTTMQAISLRLSKLRHEALIVDAGEDTAIAGRIRELENVQKLLWNEQTTQEFFDAT